MGQASDLNILSPAANNAQIGTLLNTIINAVNELQAQYNKLRTDVSAIRTGFVQHIADGSHTAAANTTAANVTADTPAALTSAATAQPAPTALT